MIRLNVGKNITQICINEKIIEESERTLYEYSINSCIFKIILTIFLIGVSVLSECVCQGIIFFITFMLMRKYTKGFHMQTRLGCFIGSCVLILMALFVIKYSSESLKDNFSLVFLSFGMVIFIVLTFFDKSKDNIYNRLSVKYKRVHLSILFTIFALGVLFYLFKKIDFTWSIIVSIYFNIVLIFVGRLKGGKVNEADFS